MGERLAGKTVLITGAGGGLGEAFARAAAAEGATLILTDLTTDAIESYRSSLPGEHRVFVHDVTDRSRWKEIIEIVARDFGVLHGLVHNAGIGTQRAFMDIDEDFWRHMMAVNLDSLVIGSQEALGLMVKSGGGSIVMISSVAGMVSGPGMAAYSASKGAARLLTKSMATEFALGRVPIRVNSVHPAFTRTPMVTSIIEASDDPERMTRRLARNSAQRRIAEPSEIAGIVIHLLSDESTFTTGAEHIVDGGLTAL